MSKRKRHNYQRVIEDRKARGELRTKRGTVSHVDVWHDDTCSVWTGGACDCEPIVRQRETIPARPGQVG